MIAPGRTLMAVAAGLGLVGGLAAAVSSPPMGIFEPITAEKATAQPDFAPVGDATPEPRELKSRPGRNVYKATRSHILNPAVAGMPERVDVPNSASGTVDVIDPAVLHARWVPCHRGR